MSTGTCDHCSQPYTVYDKELDRRFCHWHWQELLDTDMPVMDNYVVVAEE
jgi:hypothetical protein